MDKIEAHIALSGELNQVVVKSNLTWPEVILMKAIHGDAAVTNIEVIGVHEYSAFDEPARLKSLYGRRYFEIWSNYESNLPVTAPPFIPRWDDEIVVEHRIRRPSNAAAKAVNQQQTGQTNQENHPDGENYRPPGNVAQKSPPPKKAAPKPQPKIPPFKPTPIIKAPTPAPATEV